MSTRIGNACEGWLAVLGALFLAACSPISDVRSASQPKGSASAGESGLGASDAGREVMRAPARLGRACEATAVDSCSADWPPTVATCLDGAWTVQTVCRESERCQIASGTAHCMAVADECVGHEPGEPFCDAAAKMRVCIADGTSTELRCGQHERCQTLPDRVRCSCEAGAVQTASGCEEATSCVENGGCDTLTKCDMSNGTRVCGGCPGGYIGDGEHGCEPQLQALVPSCGTLEPAFAPGTHDYKLTVPTLCQALQLTVTPPDRSTSEINGTAADSSAPWQSSLLAVGETPLKVSVASEFGVNSEYRVNVNRIGSQRHYIKASNAGAGDVYGFAIAADGDTIVAGAPWEDSLTPGVPDSSNNVESGAVYVYTQRNGQWVEDVMLKADPPTALEYFGNSVALSGDTLVVGAPHNDGLGVTSLPAMGYGAAYVFTRSAGAWKQTQRLSPKDEPSGDFFGITVAMQGDTILVGAPFDDDGGSHSGAVYVFARNGDSFEQVGKKIKASDPSQSGLFGFALALDGDTFAVGAPRNANDAGAAYIFVRNGAAWEEQQRLQMPSPIANATFGFQLALRGDTAVVSASRVDLVRESTPPGEAYVFERSAGVWSHTQLITAPHPHDSDVFGAVALSDSVMAIGANGDSSGARGANGDSARTDSFRSGSVHLYAKQGGKWVPTAYLKADNADAGDLFGLNFAFAKDTLAITAGFEAGSAKGVDADQNTNDAYHAGAMYIYQ